MDKQKTFIYFIKTHKVIICLAVLLCIIFICGRVILHERKYLRVNSQNREIINEALRKNVSDIDKITKVGIGTGFNSGNLYIYRGFSKVEEINISDTGHTYGTLDSYILDNGYSFDRIALIIGSISALLIGFIIIYKIIKKMRLIIT